MEAATSRIAQNIAEGKGEPIDVARIMAVGGKRCDSVLGQSGSWVGDADGKPGGWSTPRLNTYKWKVAYGHQYI